MDKEGKRCVLYRRHGDLRGVGSLGRGRGPHGYGRRGRGRGRHRLKLPAHLIWEEMGERNNLGNIDTVMTR